MKRVGIIGFGYIGRKIYEAIANRPELGLKIAFAWNRDPRKLHDIPPELQIQDLAQARQCRPDVIVEAAHPVVTQRYGTDFLEFADYLPLSVTALCDKALDQSLHEAARHWQHRVLVPHGALPGVDTLVEGHDQWCDVTITFEKHPDAIDFSESNLVPSGDTRQTVFDGSVREIAPRFPRNVNTMVTCGLATVGLDSCRAVLIADRDLSVGILDVKATGKDGSLLRIRKEQPMSGVSGTEMAQSAIGSIIRACGGRPLRDFV